MALAHWGFSGLKNRIGHPDLFGRSMKMTTINIADALATAATLMMGETDERRPLAVVDCSDLKFADQIDSDELKMPIQDDLYYPLFAPSLRHSTSAPK